MGLHIDSNNQLGPRPTSPPARITLRVARARDGLLLPRGDQSDRAGCGLAHVREEEVGMLAVRHRVEVHVQAGPPATTTTPTTTTCARGVSVSNLVLEATDQPRIRVRVCARACV